jgi:hypothetical protein
MAFIGKQMKNLQRGEAASDLPGLGLIGPWFMMRSRPNQKRGIKAKGDNFRYPGTNAAQRAFHGYSRPGQKTKQTGKAVAFPVCFVWLWAQAKLADWIG